MTPTLPEPLEHLLRPLFDALPLNRAMGTLVVNGGAAPHLEMAERIAADPALADRPEVLAGLWLYVDQLDRSHAISQSIETPTGSFWHAIMHRREGDFSNSKYWYRRVGTHPAMSRIDLGGGSAAAGTGIGGYDPQHFVDKVGRCVHEGGRCDELVSMQRREWVALFEWCAEH